MTRFNHLNVPDHWNQYFTKYPQGYTILEALLNWVQQVSDMVDNVNNWNDYLDDFVQAFDVNLQEKVRAVLLVWQLDGTLDTIISNSTTGFLNVKQYGVVGDGVAGDSDTIQAMIDAQRALVRSGDTQPSIFVNIPAGSYIIDKPIKTYYTKFKAQGMVRFILTFNGSAFWIAPNDDDTKYTNSAQPLEMGKNVWTRGKMFDGSNGSFAFITTLDKASTGNNTSALEFGDRNTGSDARNPVSRFEIENVNVFGLNAALKFNAVNTYLLHFEHCHWEMNNNAVWWYTTMPGKVFNSGENMTFHKCIIAGSVQEAVKMEAPAFDASFLHCSFDFNASPVFNSKASGTSVRLTDCYVEKIGNGTGDQLLYQSNAQLEGETNGRSSIYIKNLITYLKRPAKMFQNLPNGSGGYINVFLDIDGIETRFDSQDPYDINNRFMLSDTEHFRLLRHRVNHGTTICKNLVSKQTNLLQNGDFSKSTLGTSLSSSNPAADNYWASSYHDSSTPPVIADGGVGGAGSNCLKYDIVRTDNTLSIYYKDLIPVEAGEILELSALFKVDKVSSRNDVRYRYEFYDSQKALISQNDYVDIFTDSSTVLTVDGTNFRGSRTYGVMYAPAGSAYVKVFIVLGNLDVTTVYIDNIHLSKSK